MSDPDIASDAQRTAGSPAYPTVTVRLSGTDGNALTIIGRVGAALRREIGNDAADTFNRAAYDCTSYDQVLQLAIATITVS